jgi:hypothetical protein
VLPCRLMMRRLVFVILLSGLGACGGQAPPPADTAQAPAAQPQGQPAQAPTPGAVPLPSGTVPWQNGTVYKVGQAVHDPASGIVILVNSVRFDDTLPDLGTGDEWAVIDLTLGNTSQAAITVRPLGDLGVRTPGKRTYYTEPTFADTDLGDKLGAPVLINTDVPPGQAVHRILPVILPSDAKDLVLWYGQGLVLGMTPEGAAKIQISLGR